VAFVPLFIAVSLLRTGLAFQLPRFRAPGHVPAPVTAPAGPGLAALMRPWFLLPCIAFALIQSTHFFLSSMGVLVWKLDGVADGWLGPLIAVSGAAEALMMFLWRRVGPHMSARTMLIVAGLVAALRWAVMATSPALPVLFLLQALHAVTFPFSYFGIMHFIANWAPEDIAAEAQSFASMLTQGFAVVTLLVFGWLVGVMGTHAYLVSTAMAIACVAAAWGSLLLRPAHSANEALRG
jgi:PPP family 3-phenylpropionic acid transporter